MYKIPEQPANSFRITLVLEKPGRLDAILVDALRKQDRNAALKNLSRRALKGLFKDRRIQIKGQPAVPSSGIAAGTTFVDILGFEESSQPA